MGVRILRFGLVKEKSENKIGTPPMGVRILRFGLVKEKSENKIGSQVTGQRLAGDRATARR